MDDHQEEWRNSFTNFEQALDEEDGEAENELLAVIATAINRMERQFISSILSNPVVHSVVQRTLKRLNLVAENDEEDEMYETMIEDETSGPFSVTLQVKIAALLSLAPCILVTKLRFVFVDGVASE